jgi:hypothetical protein
VREYARIMPDYGAWLRLLSLRYLYSSNTMVTSIRTLVRITQSNRLEPGNGAWILSNVSGNVAASAAPDTINGVTLYIES